LAPWWLRTSDDEASRSRPEAGGDAPPREVRGKGGDDPPDHGSRGDRGGNDGGGNDGGGNDGEGNGGGGNGGDRSRRRRRRRSRSHGGSRSEGSRSEGSRSEGSRSEGSRSEARHPDRSDGGDEAPSFGAEERPAGIERAMRGVVYTLQEGLSSSHDERKIAMLCDLENIALGVRDSEVKELEVQLILERLLEKGKIIVKRAYADWERYSKYKRPFHEAAVELIDIPQKYYSGKNSADIKMVVDAMDLCFSKVHLDTFVIVSGDSDFSPLVSKLKENNKYVIGIGVRNASSNLLIDNCDEFIFYEDVWRVAHRGPRLDHLKPKKAEVFGLMSDAILALVRENKDVLWGSMIKQTMQRKRPSFSEDGYGYGSFSELLEDAEREGIIGLKRDERSGSYVVTGFKGRGKR